MGKPTGFIDYTRTEAPEVEAKKRVGNFEFFHGKLSSEQRCKQAGRCMDCGVPFCQAGIQMDGKLIGCPLRNLIPEFNDQLWLGNLPMALERLLRTNCFPEFTGYVCPAPCEDACAAGKVSSPVTVNANERHIIEQAFEDGLMQPQAPRRRSGMRVSIVGSGPAGLVVAQLLNQRGHSITVYERSATPGGLLVYGIPNMKLPKQVVARRIELMEAEGITFTCGVDVGRDVTLSELSETFDAVVLAIGAQQPRVVEFKGDAPQVCFALDYLGAVAAEQLGEATLDERFNAAGKTVAIVGAGDSANDCIATALRQGAADVMQLIRRPAADYAPMADYAHAEADAVLGHDIRRFETKVAAVHTSKNGALSGLTLTTPDGETKAQAELLVIASGFSGAEPYVFEGFDKEASTNVFSAGDCTLGASLVVRAMADARNTARAVDEYLMGYTGIS